MCISNPFRRRVLVVLRGDVMVTYVVETYKGVVADREYVV